MSIANELNIIGVLQEMHMEATKMSLPTNNSQIHTKPGLSTGRGMKKIQMHCNKHSLLGSGNHSQLNIDLSHMHRYDYNKNI